MPYRDRLERFQAELGPLADLAFLPISSDLQYLTGVPRAMPNYGAVLHPGMWMEGAWLTPGNPPVLALPRMTAEFGGLGDSAGVEIRIIADEDDPLAVLRDMLKAFDLPAQPRVALSDWAESGVVVALQGLYPAARFLSATDVLRRLRVIKSEDEIALMRKAGEITEAALADVLPKLRHGMTELDLISEVNTQLQRHGSLGQSFVTSFYNSGPDLPLIFGKPLETQNRPIHPPASILFDFGAIVDGYCYDFGRTVSFGTPSDEQRRVHELVMASQAAGIAALKAGEVTAEQADKLARDVIEAGGYGEGFRHRLGHGIGLDVHEPPFLAAGDESLLQEGMLFTVEPSIMQDGGFSARVEDVVVVRPGGGEVLTSGYQDLIVVE